MITTLMIAIVYELGIIVGILTQKTKTKREDKKR